MKRIIIFAFTLLYTLAMAINVHAQAAESIWLTANTTAYKTGETVLVTINAASATPIQGFTFQIRYDPACLRPVNASSPLSGMNGLPLPQLTGLVDGSYASTVSQVVNGVLAEVRFSALKGCQTELTLESAALAIRSTEGFAMPLAGVAISEQRLSLFIDKEVGVANSSQPESGSLLPLAPPEVDQGAPEWIVWSVIALLVVLLAGLLLLGAYKVFKRGTRRRSTTSQSSRGTRKASLHIKRGPQAGKSLTLHKLPVLIGRDPQSDIYVNDPHIIQHHAQIFSERNGYYLRDLGGGTFINGHPVKSSTTILRQGDVVRLGKSFLFVFG